MLNEFNEFQIFPVLIIKLVKFYKVCNAIFFHRWRTKDPPLKLTYCEKVNLDIMNTDQLK